MKKLHPHAIVLFLLDGLLTTLIILGSIVFVIASVLAVLENWTLVLYSIIFSLPLLLGLPIIWAYLSYQNYRYILEDKAIRIEKGVIWKREVSIPYERVQNVDIVRGPITRLLGLSDVRIQTAGYHTPTYIKEEGRIPGVDPQEALRVRNQIISRISISKNDGV